MIYYSHINEDNSVEREILNATPFEELVCIAGSGERLIALLDNPNLKRIHIVDNNKNALYLAQLKLAVLKAYPVTTYLGFLGASESKIDRRDIFNEIKNSLPEDCTRFWEDHLHYIKKGVLHVGHFERFLSKMRPLIKIYLGKKFYQCFQLPFSACKNFPHRRWALLRWLFSKRLVYLLSGNKDIAFISKEGRQQFIPQGLHQTLLHETVHKNPMFHLVLNGHLNMMPAEEVPASLNKEVLANTKQLLQENSFEINYYEEDILTFAKSHALSKKGKAFYSLSDILSFIDFDYIKQLFKTIQIQSHSPSTVVLRTFIRNRITEGQLLDLEKNFGVVEDMSAFENTRMYQVYKMTLKS